MKSFRTTEILTTDDGRIILNGPSGSIDIFRRQDGSGTHIRLSKVQLFTLDSECQEVNWHKCQVSEIPDSRRRFAYRELDIDGAIVV